MHTPTHTHTHTRASCNPRVCVCVCMSIQFGFDIRAHALHSLTRSRVFASARARPRVSVFIYRNARAASGASLGAPASPGSHRAVGSVAVTRAEFAPAICLRLVGVTTYDLNTRLAVSAQYNNNQRKLSHTNGHTHQPHTPPKRLIRRVTKNHNCFPPAAECRAVEWSRVERGLGTACRW